MTRDSGLMSGRRLLNVRVIPSSARVTFDRLLLRAFPAIVITLAIMSLILWVVFYRDDLQLRNLLYSICCAYATGFALIGIPSLLFPRKSLYPRSHVAVMLFIIALGLGSTMWLVFGDSGLTPNYFITSFFYILNWSVHEISMVSVILGTVSLALIVVLVTYGVLETLNALLGENLHRVFLSLVKPGDGKLKRYTRKMFMIPDIIDIDDVTINPRVCDGFDLELFGKVSRYLIGLSLLFASYLFLNPVFLLSIPLQEMMVIMILLSLFVSAIVVPIFLVRMLGAEAHSSGNRPLLLWKGLKNRYIHVGYCICLFLTLLWVCLFIGVDTVTILSQYVWFIVFMLMTSALVSFIYVNSFSPETQGNVTEKFERAKSELEKDRKS